MPQFDINLTRDVENWGKIRQVAQERKEISFHVANLELREAPNEADRIGLKKKKKSMRHVPDKEWIRCLSLRRSWKLRQYREQIQTC